jgi:hypothetical protein
MNMLRHSDQGLSIEELDRLAAAESDREHQIDLAAALSGRPILTFAEAEAFFAELRNGSKDRSSEHGTCDGTALA